MNPTIEGEVTLIYVKHGVSKSGANYLILANGRKEFPVFGLNEDQLKEFDGMESDDEVTMQIALTAGSDQIKVLDVVR